MCMRFSVCVIPAVVVVLSFFLPFARSYARSLARSLGRSFVFRGALARSTARLGRSLLLAVSLSLSLSLWHARPRARASPLACVYVRVPREKVWQEMCPRDKPTSSTAAFKMAVISPARTRSGTTATRASERRGGKLRLLIWAACYQVSHADSVVILYVGYPLDCVERLFDSPEAYDIRSLGPRRRIKGRMASHRRVVVPLSLFLLLQNGKNCSLLFLLFFFYSSFIRLLPITRRSDGEGLREKSRIWMIDFFFNLVFSRFAETVYGRASRCADVTFSFLSWTFIYMSLS